jgi:hypothetical protein
MINSRPPKKRLSRPVSVLVFGGAGFIGTLKCDRIVDEGKTYLWRLSSPVFSLDNSFTVNVIFWEHYYPRKCQYPKKILNSFNFQQLIDIACYHLSKITVTWEWRECRHFFNDVICLSYYCYLFCFRESFFLLGLPKSLTWSMGLSSC